MGAGKVTASLRPFYINMKYVLRDYQRKASDAAVSMFMNKRRFQKNGLLVLPTGSGKSLIISDIAARIDAPLLVFNPQKEILEQNVAKFQSYGIWDFGVYSASVGKKDINRVTFATIKSVYNHKEDFAHFKYILIDECHQVNSLSGQYKEFLESENRIVIGLTATPYRLCRGEYGGSMLKFLTRTRPRVFQCLLYYVQISELLAQGFLAKLTYYDLTNKTSFDITKVRANSTGAEFDEKSMRAELERSGFKDELVGWTQRVLTPKKGAPRKGVLVFTQFVKESDYLVGQLKKKGIPAAVVSADTPKAERERILEDFKAGRIRVVANAATLTTGFDYPELDTVIMARATMSLSLWYQIVGRAIRPYPGKQGWIVDLCGNVQRFGHVEDLRIECEEPNSGRWCVMSKGRQLTNVTIYR